VAVEMRRKAILIESSPTCQAALTDRLKRSNGQLFY